MTVFFESGFTYIPDSKRWCREVNDNIVNHFPPHKHRNFVLTFQRATCCAIYVRPKQPDAFFIKCNNT